MGSKCIKRKS